jgi:hypothetical protein
MKTKKAFIILVVFLMGGISLNAQVLSKVNTALAQFEKEYPEYAGKAYTTSNNRSWQDQMRILLSSSNPENYKNIKSRFTQKFGITFPTSQTMTSEMLTWWEREITPENGFYHIDGRAVDVSVRSLNSQGTQLLAGVLQKNGLSILYEQGEKYERSYFVGTLLLHCY